MNDHLKSQIYLLCAANLGNSPAAACNLSLDETNLNFRFEASGMKEAL